MYFYFLTNQYSATNIKLIIERKAICRLQRKSSNALNKNLTLTSGKVGEVKFVGKGGKIVALAPRIIG